MEEVLREIYCALDQVLRKGAYINIVFSGEFKHRSAVTFVVKGVVENYFSLKYALETLAPRGVKPALKPLLMAAMFMLKHGEIPGYAVVNETVAFAGKKFGSGVKGFVNAVLKKYPTLPEPEGIQKREAELNAPEFIIEALEKDGVDPKTVLRPPASDLVHFRLGRKGKTEDLSGLETLTRSEAGGWFSMPDTRLKELNASGKITFISPSSMECVNAFGNINGKKYLDVCAAPGGKSVYAAEKGAEVTAADLYPHRVKLIEAYADRMGVKLNALQNDALCRRQEWLNAFDCVAVDAPCMGLGVISYRPDVTINKRPGDVETIVPVQKAILSEAAEYVAPGGRLVYSTCSVLKAETEEVIKDFLKKRGDFSIYSYKNNTDFGRLIMPDGKWDGFFICVTEKKK